MPPDEITLQKPTRERQLETALREVLARTYCHCDGRDLLAELHPRKTLDIKRRVDGVETWFEGDWLSNLMDARRHALAVLRGEPVPLPRWLAATETQQAALTLAVDGKR